MKRTLIFMSVILLAFQCGCSENNDPDIPNKMKPIVVPEPVTPPTPASTKPEVPVSQPTPAPTKPEVPVSQPTPAPTKPEVPVSQ
ncbi:MAG: hypothetical protein LBC74_14840, partial [Planctomycetaceae bacterium]|nr:hypothetical protein [Planctomycetaceae bacterium]